MITSERQLAELCQRLEGAKYIAFDTEFVSEHSYRPQLCLVQVEHEGHLAVIDPLAVRELTIFWKTLAAPGHETIVHAGREELIFCLESAGARPANLFDTQIAAALMGLEYPAGYGNLVSKLLGVVPKKGETRTDWRRRPLSDRQIEYALVDVEHLWQLRNRITNRLAELGRESWLATEMEAWQAEVQNSRTRERWRRVAGSGSLPARGLAVVREIWNWREQEAERRNCPVRQVLRDDLICELAKRRSADPKQISAVRGMQRGDLRRAMPALAECVERALALPDGECPRVVRSETSNQLTMLGQFLSSALSSICHGADVAPSLVGTASDVRDLVAFNLGDWDSQRTDRPILTEGWRAEVVGQKLADLLTGRLAIRIHDPRSQHPLAFEPVGKDPPGA